MPHLRLLRRFAIVGAAATIALAAPLAAQEESEPVPDFSERSQPAEVSPEAAQAMAGVLDEMDAVIKIAAE